jgi:putative transcriptional regulator
MTKEILSSLREAANVLRSGRNRKLTFGPKQIKKVREKFELTQGEFAERIGVSIKTVQSWEQGERNPGIIAKVMIGAMLSEEKTVENVS